MTDWLFYIFAILAVFGALSVAISRNPVNAAMGMIVSFIGMAALFVLLETYFLAVLQILVYAGAIVVLFLFIIMLMDVSRAAAPKPVALIASAAALGVMVAGSWFISFSELAGPFPERSVEAPAAVAKMFGVELFTRHILAFQVIGFLLLISMIGVIIVSRKMPQPTEGGAK